ncbi:MAG: hypothetical protein ACOYVG_08790 [Bacteroidota bacterium]|jgi:hypothetical protein
MANESKIIRKTDDSAMHLIYDVVGDKAKFVSDIDSYYLLNGKYVFLEFIKCAVKPFDYNPNQNWNEIQLHLNRVWEFASKAEGSLWLICYDDSKDQFNLYKVSLMDDTKAEFQSQLNQNIDEFKKWFQLLNSEVLKK